MGRSAQRQPKPFVPAHRTWPFVAGVATIALGAGVLIAGVPQSSEAFVMPADITTTTSTIAVAAVGGVGATADDLGVDVGDGTVAVASAAPVPSTTVTAVPQSGDRAAQTSGQQTQAASTASAQAAVTTTTVPSAHPDRESSAEESVDSEAERAVVSTTVAASMSASAGTVPPPTTVPADALVTDSRDTVTVEPARVSVVVVNGADEAGLAGRTARLLAGKGYTDTSTTDALQTTDRTTIFYAPGFEDEAAELAGAMGLWAPLEPRPTTAITVNGAEADADLVLLLGPTR